MKCYYPVVIAGAIVALPGGSSAIVSAQEKQSAIAAPVLADVLSVLAEKAKLQQRRNFTDSFVYFARLISRYEEGGIVDPADALDARTKLEKARLLLLEQQKNYDNAHDRLLHRHKLSEKELDELFKNRIGPLLDALDRFDKAVVDVANFDAGFAGLPWKKQGELRTGLRKLFTTSALTRNSKELLANWKALEKASNAELEQQTKDLDAKDSDYQKRRRAREAAGKPFDWDDWRRQRETLKKVDLLNFEMALRAFEAKPSQASFNRLKGPVSRISADHCAGRFEQARKSWPKMAPLPALKPAGENKWIAVGPDLAWCDWDTAVMVLQKHLKEPDALLAGKTRLREARTLFAAYPLRQEIVANTYLLCQTITAEFTRPSAEPPIPKIDLPLPPGLTADPAQLTLKLMQNGIDLHEATMAIIGTWVDYQRIHLDVSQELGISMEVKEK